MSNKIDKALIAKVIAATVIPGGFIAWGMYEFGKFVGRKQNEERVKDGDEHIKSVANAEQTQCDDISSSSSKQVPSSDEKVEREEP